VTHDVFPKCDFAYSPCYHSKEADLVRIDGEHTIREVEKQMTYLRKRRGPGQYAQLVGVRSHCSHPMITPERFGRYSTTIASR